MLETDLNLSKMHVITLDRAGYYEYIITRNILYM